MKEFTCKECGGHRVEEVMVDVTVSSTITDVHRVGSDPNEVCLEYGLCSHEDGEVENYQCLDCGANVTVDELLALAED